MYLQIRFSKQYYHQNLTSENPFPFLNAIQAGRGGWVQKFSTIRGFDGEVGRWRDPENGVMSHDIILVSNAYSIAKRKLTSTMTMLHPK